LIALIINAHQIERDGHDADFVSLFKINARPCGQAPTLRPDFHRD